MTLLLVIAFQVVWLLNRSFELDLLEDINIHTDGPLIKKMSHFMVIPSQSNKLKKTHNVQLGPLCNLHGLVSKEPFHMTSSLPYWCPKTIQQRPCRSSKQILWDYVNPFFRSKFTQLLLSCGDLQSNNNHHHGSFYLNEVDSNKNSPFSSFGHGTAKHFFDLTKHRL